MSSSSDVQAALTGVLATGMVGQFDASALERYSGYAALLDVLGFREIVGRDRHRDYMQTVSQLSAEPSQAGELQYVLFSDTVVISTNGDSKDHLFSLLKACSSLVDALLKQSIAIRGAIAHGTLDRHISQRGIVVAGMPIVEAHHYEQQQDWIGVMLCPSVLDKEPDLADACGMPQHTGGQDPREYMATVHWSRFLRNVDVPFHPSEGRYRGLAMVPLSGAVETPAEARRSLKDFLQALQKMKMAAPGPASQRKYDHTIEFVRPIVRQWPL